MTSRSQGPAKYENFQDEFDEDFDNIPSYRTTTAFSNGNLPLSEIEMLGNGVSDGDPTRFSESRPGPTSSIVTTHNSYLQPKRIRLRAVESERDYFLKRLNVDLLRNLVLVQIIASVLTVFSQVAIYVISTRETYRIMDRYALGLWSPVIFLTAALLTSMITKTPSGHSVGSAMGFQISSIVSGTSLLFYSTYSLFDQGMSSYSWESTQSVYNYEVPRRIFYSIIILTSMVELMAAIMTSIQCCKVTCCAKSNDHDNIMFDVETVAA